MKFVFRVDSSIQIGTGHVMRCITLANHLKSKGHQCIFISRAHDGHISSYVLDNGHKLYLNNNFECSNAGKNANEWNDHAHWLGVDWSIDAIEFIEIIKIEKPDWLIVDHYAIDSNWEDMVRPFIKKIFVIDDLQDRSHNCDILLDQTFGRKDIAYKNKVPSHCRILCGSKYSLLRKEFQKLRDESLLKRESPKLGNILVNLGGIDKDNYTSLILKNLKSANLPSSCSITIVMGENAPWISCIKKIASKMPWKTDLKIGVNSMAEIMTRADLAIGAAGSSTWERCCLGLPTIQLAIAKNQKFISDSLHKSGIIKPLDNVESLPNLINNAQTWMLDISKRCRLVTDGDGVNRVIKNMEISI